MTEGKIMTEDKKINYIVLPIRIDEDSYNELRKLAYDKKISMAKIIRKLILNKLKKKVD